MAKGQSKSVARQRSASKPVARAASKGKRSSGVTKKIVKAKAPVRAQQVAASASKVVNDTPLANITATPSAPAQRSASKPKAAAPKVAARKVQAKRPAQKKAQGKKVQAKRVQKAKAPARKPAAAKRHAKK